MISLVRHVTDRALSTAHAINDITEPSPAAEPCVTCSITKPGHVANWLIYVIREPGSVIVLILWGIVRFDFTPRSMLDPLMLYHHQVELRHPLCCAWCH